MPTARELMVLVASTMVALLIVEVVRRVLTSRMVSRWPLAPLIVRRCVRPGFAVAFVAGATAGLPPGSSLGDAAGAIRRGCAIAVIASVTWLIVQAAFAATDGLLDHLVKIDNDRRVRRMRTQVMLLRRTAAAIMVIIAVASILFTFPPVRAVGAGLLASVREKYPEALPRFRTDVTDQAR